MDITLIVGIAFLVFGAIFILIYVLQQQKAKAAEAWPTAPGVVLSSGLEERRSRNTKTHTTTITYSPKIEYEYTLMGQKYTGTKLAFGYASYDYRTASEKIAPYQPGTSVQVHYDPSKPDNAVLETRAAGAITLLIVGIVFIVFAAIFGFLKLF